MNESLKWGKLPLSFYEAYITMFLKPSKDSNLELQIRDLIN